jgi:hypothetical protein
MRTKRLAVLMLLSGCGTAPGADKAPDTTAAASPPVAAMKAFPLADAAGTWTYVAKSVTGDTVLVTAELSATADPSGWTMTLPGRPKQPVTVTMSGDSVMTSVGPYESVLRKGVQVRTESVLRMIDGKMIGTSTAHYSVKGADSVRGLLIEATRKP